MLFDIIFNRTLRDNRIRQSTSLARWQPQQLRKLWRQRLRQLEAYLAMN